MDIEAKINRSEVKTGAFIGKYTKSFLGNKVIAISIAILKKVRESLVII